MIRNAIRFTAEVEPTDEVLVFARLKFPDSKRSETVALGVTPFLTGKGPASRPFAPQQQDISEDLKCLAQSDSPVPQSSK